MSSGSPWSKAFIDDLSEKEFRDEFVADQIRVRLAAMIRALREQDGRNWSQAELGRRMGKAQNVVSRLEDPDYGKMSLATLLEVASAFDLPLWIDIPEWSEWLLWIKEVPGRSFKRKSFNAPSLIAQARFAQATSATADPIVLSNHSTEGISYVPNIPSHSTVPFVVSVS